MTTGPAAAVQAGRETGPASSARTAWLLTITAADFFEKIAFRRRPRAEAPAAILATREAKSLCPVSAVLLAKTIGF